MTQNTESKLPTTQSERASYYGKTSASNNRYRAMFYAFISGMSVVDIARDFNCSQSTVYQALEVIENKYLGAPDKVKLAYVVHSRQKSIRMVQGMIEKLDKQQTKLLSMANKESANGKSGIWLSIERAIQDNIKVQQRLIDQIRKEDWDLSLFWNVMKTSGKELRVSDKPDGLMFSGEEHAMLMGVIDEEARKRGLRKLDEPRPEHAHRNVIGVG